MIALALLAFLVRLVIIARSHGGQDLQMYTYFSRLPLHGVNPYASPSGGLFPPVDGNNPPLEQLLYFGLLAIHDSPTMLRVLFALADVSVVLLVGLYFPRSRGWRAGFILFYALNPFVLFAWTAFAEDKTLLFLGIAAWVLALERGREWGTWAVATALSAFKFLGAFAVPAQAIDSFRRRGWWALAPLAAFLVCFALSNLPWFPHSLDAFSRRNERLSINPPFHASPTLLLARIGLYAPIEAKLLTALAIALVLALFVARRIDIREAVVLSIFGGYVFLPDDAFTRLLLIALPLMLLIELSLARWVVLWVLTSIEALAGVVATRGVPHWLAGVGGPLRTVFGREATVPHVLWMSALPAILLAFYLYDRRRGAAPVEPVAIDSTRSNASAIAS